jgi:hypothetical protein
MTPQKRRERLAADLQFLSCLLQRERAICGYPVRDHRPYSSPAPSNSASCTVASSMMRSSALTASIAC